MIDKNLIDRLVQEFYVNKLYITEEEIFKSKIYNFNEKLKNLIEDLQNLIENSDLFEEYRLSRVSSCYILYYDSKSYKRYENRGIKISLDMNRNRVEINFKIKIFINFLGMKILDKEGEFVRFDPLNPYYYEKDDFIKFKQSLENNLFYISDQEIEFVNKILLKISNLISEVKNESDLLKVNIKNSILEVDKDDNGEVDLIDGESFNKLLNKHQQSISEIDKNYIQKFVKISIYLKTKKKNTQQLFESIKETKSGNELEELLNLLKNQINTYELLVFHSISMITSLVENDLITFYEIYESLDQLGIFNSNWENEVSNKLSDIGDGIQDLIYSIDKMEYNIVNSLENLTYLTQDSFSDLNKSITSQLSSIDSSINFNNLLTGIQTYQMYKINQNTKRIN
jgi:hypothetical protein